MPDFLPRMLGYRVLATLVLVICSAVTVILLLNMFVTGVEPEEVTWQFLLAITFLTLGLASYGILQVLLSIEEKQSNSTEILDRMVRHLERTEEALYSVKESILLSDDAKSIAFRDKDLNALRKSIEDHFDREDWEATSYLVDQLATRYGCVQEAQGYRDRIDNALAERKRQQLAIIVAKLDDLIAVRNWDEGAKLVDGMRLKLGECSEVASLGEKLNQAKDEQKKHLLKSLDQSVKRKEFDKAADILKELDGYLTGSEVAALQESARDVFKAKLHGMGVQFSLYVTEGLWSKALELGQQIIEQFPNSQMASEIRERLETLRTRADGVETSEKSA